jgi:hypothetical protein
MDSNLSLREKSIYHKSIIINMMKTWIRIGDTFLVCGEKLICLTGLRKKV